MINSISIGTSLVSEAKSVQSRGSVEDLHEVILSMLDFAPVVVACDTRLLEYGGRHLVPVRMYHRKGQHVTLYNPDARTTTPQMMQAFVKQASHTMSAEQVLFQLVLWRCNMPRFNQLLEPVTRSMLWPKP